MERVDRRANDEDDDGQSEQVDDRVDFVLGSRGRRKTNVAVTADASFSQSNAQQKASSLSQMEAISSTVVPGTKPFVSLGGSNFQGDCYG